MHRREKKVKVLVIEDDEQEVERIRDYLDRCLDMNYIGSAGGSSEGIRLTQELRPDAVILDLELMEGSGLYYLDAWRAGELGCDPIVLVLTGLTSWHTVDAARRRGADYRYFKGREDYIKDGPKILVDMLRELEPDGLPHTKMGNAGDVMDDIQFALSRVGGRLGNITLNYLVYAIYLVSRMPMGPINLSKDIYPLVAAKFDTTLGAVQRGICYCVLELYNKVDRSALEAVYTPELKDSTNAAEVKQFIIYFAGRFRNR